VAGIHWNSWLNLPEILGLTLHEPFDPIASWQYVRHILRTDVTAVSESPTTYHSLSVASRRRQQIIEFLGSSEERSILGVEFLETFGASPDLRSSELSRGNAIGQQARLARQLDEAPLLLLDHVIDYVTLLRRRGLNMIQAVRLDCAPDIRVPRATLYTSPSHPIFSANWYDYTTWRDHWWLPFDSMMRSERFPWRVVIEVDGNAGVVMSEFKNRELLEWFGIGIDLAPSRDKPRPSFLCNQSGETGVIGGLINAHKQGTDGFDRLFGLTCAHVVTDKCNCVVEIGWDGKTANGGSDVHEPDAALVNVEMSSCVEELRKGLQRVRPSTGPSDSARNNPTTELAPSERTRLLGYIFNPLWSYPMCGHYHRVPSIDIKPFMYKNWYKAARYPFERTFSRPGDSGSWVVDKTDRSQWYGMIAANEPKFKSSYAIDSMYLYDYFSRKLVDRYGENLSLQAWI
jgi:hypothetical protein